MSAINALWFTTIRGCIGFVLVETVDGYKCYVGVGEGADEQLDMQYIERHGARVHQPLCEAVFPLVNRRDWYRPENPYIETIEG